MQRFWIFLSMALALAAPPAFAGKLASVEQAAKTFIAKKEPTAKTESRHGLSGIGHGDKAAQLVRGAKSKLLGK